MSYSFNVKASSKIEAKAEVALSLSALAKSQPEHAVDVDSAAAAASAYIDLLQDDATAVVHVEVIGSIWKTASGLREAGVNVIARLVPKEL